MDYQDSPAVFDEMFKFKAIKNAIGLLVQC